MECSPNAVGCFCAGHRFSPREDKKPLTWNGECDMITVLGRIFSGPFFMPVFRRRKRLPGPGRSRSQRNDPRHPSGVISFPWVQSLGNLAFCWIDRAFVMVWISSEAFMFLSFLFAIGIYVKRKKWKPSRQVYLPYLVSPFFVPSVYHIARLFTRRDFTQITCE